jgi:hypothetical protein
MAHKKFTYHIDNDTNEVTEVYKHGNKVEYRTMSKEQYEKEDGIASLVAFGVIAIIVISILARIF